jgi:hypothetical protein
MLAAVLDQDLQDERMSKIFDLFCFFQSHLLLSEAGFTG